MTDELKGFGRNRAGPNQRNIAESESGTERIKINLTQVRRCLGQNFRLRD
jgi:hypothetical protein